MCSNKINNEQSIRQLKKTQYKKRNVYKNEREQIEEEKKKVKQKTNKKRDEEEMQIQMQIVMRCNPVQQ